MKIISLKKYLGRRVEIQRFLSLCNKILIIKEFNRSCKWYAKLKVINTKDTDARREKVRSFL